MKTTNKFQAVHESHEPIHQFFGLSYASYLVIPRSLLQSCSIETQRALCEALEMVYKEEAKNMPDHWPKEADIMVRLRDCVTKKYIKDPFADYERGRRRLWEPNI